MTSPLPLTALAAGVAIAGVPALAPTAFAQDNASASGNASLTVTVTGLRSTKGRLIACLWQDKAGFPTCEKSKTALRREVAVSATSMKVTFAGIAPGKYAATVVHDEDANGRLKTNFIGMPKEGVAVSNNPGGIPSFSKSLTTVAGASAISVTMRYL